MRIKSDRCSRCKVALRAASGRYCNPCKAAYMRGWRPEHPLLGEAHMKAKARSKLHNNIYKGHIQKLSCYICNSISSEAYIKDYSKPLEVEWICKTCKISTKKTP